MLWFKAVHVVAVVAWFAGLFYLPRLYVYHAAATPGSELSATFKIMERRLLRLIMNPAMMVVWVTGPWLAWWEGAYMDGWLQAKFALVLALTWFHHELGRWRKAFAEDRNTRSAKFYRIANEVPTVLLVGIVILVIIKPF